jgi:methionine synthase I (cobalamin-dependent)
VLEHPEVVTELHREFVHAGSDVVEAVTYYGHREKLRIIGKEYLLEELNRRALDLARTVAAAAFELGVRYLGVCCGAGPHHIRSLAESVGRTPAASRYTADMSKHAFLGTDPSLRRENQEFAETL